MSNRVSPKLDVRRLSSAQRFRGCRKSRINAEVIEQPIKVKTKKILLIAEHGIPEGTVQKPDITEIEGMDFEGNRCQGCRPGGTRRVQQKKSTQDAGGNNWNQKRSADY